MMIHLLYFVTEGTETFFLYYRPPVACLDDLRVSGRRLPLPPALNTTSWGQMTTTWQLAQGCRPREDPCTGSRCAPPLTCTPAWDQPSCRSVTVTYRSRGPLLLFNFFLSHCLSITVLVRICGRTCLYVSCIRSRRSCGPGRHLVGDVCEDVDECQWQPCLHGGTCQNLRPGFLCACEPTHLGDHCQWIVTPREAHPFAVHAGVAVLALSLLLLGK